VIEAYSHEFIDKKEEKMAKENLTLKLTNDQQKQIREATGKNISELTIEIASKGQLTEEDLKHIAGGATKKKC
jgi:uncharacterized protein (DUF1778 family)